MKNLIGKTIKSYQILLKVRETGTRILYRASDVRSDHYVGLEVVKAENVQQKVMYAALKEQAEKNARLKHTNIAPLLDSGVSEGIIYFVYDFAPARTLHRLFNQSYPWKRVAREFVTVAQTLAHAHQQGVVHGMLEPSSIILNDEHAPYLYDFGMEQIIQNHLLSRAPGAWMQNWKYPYASPEQLSGKAADAGSDVYSMGIMLYEWITGEIPLLDETTLGTLYRRRTTGLDDLALKKIVPDMLQELVRRTIATDPAGRYRSMEEVSIVLARESLGLELTGRIIRKPLTALQASGKQSRKWLLLPVLSVVILGIAFAAWQGMPELYPGLAAILSRSATPSPTAPIPTATHKPLPTLSPATALPDTPSALPTSFAASTITYPLGVGDELPPLNSLDSGNANRIIQLAIWEVGEFSHFEFSSDGQTAIFQSVGTITSLNPGNGRLVYSVPGTILPGNVFSSTGKYYAALYNSTTIRVYESASGSEFLAFSGNSNVATINFLGKVDFLCANGGGIRIWSISSGQELIEKDALQVASGNWNIIGGNSYYWYYQGRWSTLPSVTNSDETLRATAMEDHTIHIQDLSSGSEIITLYGHLGDVTDLHFTNDGKLLASSSRDGTVRLWGIP